MLGHYPRKRSLTGCLTCRRRKKKCDETKSICNACRRNFLECEWPANSKRVDKKASPPKYGNHVIQDHRKASLSFHISRCNAAQFVKNERRTNWHFKKFSVNLRNGKLFQYNSNNLQFVEIDDFPTSSDEIDVMLDSSSTHQKAPLNANYSDSAPLLDTVSHHLDLQLESFIEIDVPLNAIVERPADSTSQYKVLADARAPQTVKFETLFQMCKKKEPVSEIEFTNVDMEKFLFYSCLRGYIPKMTTQYTHSSLTTEATFIPQVEKNVIMKEIFLCCGATYLAWNNVQKFQNISDELYSNCKLMICNYIGKNDNFADEDWLFAALQLLCNRDKNSLTGTSDDAAWHLVRAYDIIRLKYYGIKSSENIIINKLANPNLILQPLERTLIESFIYQFSVSVLFIQNFQGLPSPFKIFKILNVVLKCPVYNCEHVVDWMKNPILGSSLDSFEILAKLSFIGRTPWPLAEECIEQVTRLRSMCEFYTPAAPSKLMGGDHWCNFKINSLVGIITAKSCWLFATKLLNFMHFDLQDPTVQEYVDSILTSWRKIPVGHSVWGILSWSLLVTGVFVADQEQRATVLNYVDIWSERTHSYNSFKIASFLRRAWASDDAPSFIFDRTQLGNVSM